MFKILVHMQDQENYGAHCCDGKGECPQYWKFKGGDSIVIAELPLQDVLDLAEQGEMGVYVETLINLKDIVQDDDYFKTSVIDWELVEDKDIEIVADEDVQMIMSTRKDLDYAGSFLNMVTDKRGWLFMKKES